MHTKIKGQTNNKISLMILSPSKYHIIGSLLQSTYMDIDLSQFIHCHEQVDIALIGLLWADGLVKDLFRVIHSNDMAYSP